MVTIFAAGARNSVFPDHGWRDRKEMLQVQHHLMAYSQGGRQPRGTAKPTEENGSSGRREPIERTKGPAKTVPPGITVPHGRWVPPGRMVPVGRTTSAATLLPAGSRVASRLSCRLG